MNYWVANILLKSHWGQNKNKVSASQQRLFKIAKENISKNVRRELKTPALFSDWPRGKHPPAGLLFLIVDPPPTPTPGCVFPAANTRGGSTNFVLCKNGSDSLWPFAAPLLDVCSFLNVTAQTECDEQNENNLGKEKKRKENAGGENVTTSWGAEEFPASLEKTRSGELKHSQRLRPPKVRYLSEHRCSIMDCLLAATCECSI